MLLYEKHPISSENTSIRKQNPPFHHYLNPPPFSSLNSSPPTLRQLKPTLAPNLPHLPLIRLRRLGLLPRLLQAAKAKPAPVGTRLRRRLQHDALAFLVAEDGAVDPFALVDEMAAGVEKVVPCAHCEE